MTQTTRPTSTDKQAPQPDRPTERPQAHQSNGRAPEENFYEGSGR
jgi:hypothetical protein